MSSQSPPFPSAAFAKLANAEANHWWFRARNRLLLWVLDRKLSRFSSFLEIGCGTGFVLAAIRKRHPQAALFGAEFFAEGLAFARQRVPSAHFVQLDATLMHETACYDVIGAFDVIEHIQEDEKVLSNVFRALKSGGSILITVPQHRWLWSSIDEQACHVRRYSRAELIQKVQYAGFGIEYVTSFVSLLLPLMWLARRRTSKSEQDPMSEFRIPAWLNWSLEAVMKIEFVLLSAGVRFPVGGSLLLVAGKPMGDSN